MGSSVTCMNTEQINELLDGEADPNQESESRKHLEQCAECRQQYEFYSRFRQMLRQSCSQESCPELVQARLKKALLQEVATPKPAAVPAKASTRRGWGLGWLAAASAAAFSLYALRPATEKAPPLALSLSQDHSRCSSRPVVGGQPEDPGNLAERTFGAAMPEMVKHQALRPYDVRLCPVLEGEQVIHVLCHDQQKRVVSVFAAPSARVGSTEGTESSPMLFGAGDSQVATWEHKGWVFSLVAGGTREEMATLADNCQYCCPHSLATESYSTPPLASPGLPIRAIPASHRP